MSFAKPLFVIGLGVVVGAILFNFAAQKIFAQSPRLAIVKEYWFYLYVAVIGVLFLLFYFFFVVKKHISLGY